MQESNYSHVYRDTKLINQGEIAGTVRDLSKYPKEENKTLEIIEGEK